MNNHPQRVLITGHKGYIGSVLTPIFVRAGHEVVGLDTGYFADCTLIPDPIEVPALQKDIRNVEPSDLRGFDAIVHLAALSNDPIGNLNDAWTGEINHKASVRLAEMAREAGVKRLLFSSSCIMYGMSELSEVNEDCPLHPQTEYARSKVAAEHDIRQIAAAAFSPVYLRNGTIYGISPRMRFDTVFNDFMAAAVCTGKITVHSDGTPWRPVIHVEDVARAFLRVLEAKAEQIHNRAFNIGANDLNYQVGALAAIAAEAVPGCSLAVTANPGADQRTYRCDFSRFAGTFPDFVFQWNARKAAPVMRDTLRALGVTTAVWKDPRFTRLLWLRQLMQGHQVDENLRWTAEAGVAAAAR
jgi:nucleoside-diphosphate-sugar epimerase